jgi:hypothetical protein
MLGTVPAISPLGPLGIQQAHKEHQRHHREAHQEISADGQSHMTSTPRTGIAPPNGGIILRYWGCRSSA